MKNKSKQERCQDRLLEDWANFLFDVWAEKCRKKTKKLKLHMEKIDKNKV